MSKFSRFAVLTAACIATGCANLNSVYRPLDTSGGQGALIDIKQRAIVVSKPRAEGGRSVICAEPSPDALSVYAAQLAAEGSIPQKAAASLSGSFQEGGSFVGLRTQSIQLLRDGLYRLCEGYASGALKEWEYDILMRRYQKYMVALLGIEQLSGVVRAPTVTITSQGSAEAARSLASLRAEGDAIDAQIKKLEDQKTSATDAQKTEIDKQIAAKKSDKELVSKAIENNRGLLTAGSTSAAVVVPTAESKLAADQAAVVAKEIQEIVLRVIDTDDLGQMCFSNLLNNQIRAESPLSTICAEHLSSGRRVNDVKLKYLESVVDHVKSGKSPLNSSEIERMFKDLGTSVAHEPRERLPGV